jgi:AcrR family transcriptional regulator
VPSDRGGRYHHGDLRAALVDTAVDLVAERGVTGFSLAEASRRLGVAPSAPYAHFADREALLAAVAVRGYGVLDATYLPRIRRHRDPARRLAAIAHAYVSFAGTHRPLFEVLYRAGVGRRPEVKAAERPLGEAFDACVRALGCPELAGAVEATAHGHAMLLLDGEYGEGAAAVARAAQRAARATLALAEGRRLLRRRYVG